MHVHVESIVTCPACALQTPVEMPLDACQFFWQCPGCKSMLRPIEGDCCVFCSYGDTVCPPVQRGDCDGGRMGLG